MKIDENNIFAVLTIGSSVLLVLLAVCGLFFISASFAIGVVAGGIAAIANCHWLYRILQRAMGLPAQQAVRFAQATLCTSPGNSGNNCFNPDNLR